MRTVMSRLFSSPKIIQGILVMASVFFVASSSVNSEETSKEQDVKADTGAEKEQGDEHKASPRRDVKAAGTTVSLEPDSRGKPDLTVCSQNLKLFGTLGVMQRRDAKLSAKTYALKKRELVERFIAAKCDVIGVQEVVGGNPTETEAAMKELVDELRGQTNRLFQYRIAPPAEGKMTIGFLVAMDRAEILHTLSYSRVELPRIQKKQRPRVFSRTPLEIQLAVKSRDGDVVKNVSVINFHFKSKRGGQDDPTGLEWETYRMEMAEALRRIVEVRHKDSFASGRSILLLLGDRNSNFDVATARILEGSLTLSSFSENGSCRLSKRAVPLCKSGAELPRRLFSVLTTDEGLKSRPGTFEYRGEYSWLDEIAAPAETLPYAWRTPFSEGDYDSGVVYEPKDASDHALVYVRLNW
jgi:hypothetical protein